MYIYIRNRFRHANQIYTFNDSTIIVIDVIFIRDVIIPSQYFCLHTFFLYNNTRKNKIYTVGKYIVFFDHFVQLQWCAPMMMDEWEYKSERDRQVTT